MPKISLVLLLSFGGVLSRPSEQPTKFDLSPLQEAVGNFSEATMSHIEKGKELFGQVADAVRFGRGRLVNSASMARNIIASRAEEVANEAQNNVASVIAAKGDLLAQGRSVLQSLPKATLFNFLPPLMRETTRLENENAQGFLERQKPGPAEGFLQSFLRPTPLLDGITESEKYGNSGDKFGSIGRALVGGFEGLSNFLNSVLDFPIDAAKKTSRGLTETLNHIGARIIGLQ